MQLNPARGRKLAIPTAILSGQPRFMQLNPARGRKLQQKLVTQRVMDRVYAAQPREGTETFLITQALE